MTTERCLPAPQRQRGRVSALASSVELSWNRLLRPATQVEPRPKRQARRRRQCRRHGASTHSLKAWVQLAERQPSPWQPAHQLKLLRTEVPGAGAGGGAPGEENKAAQAVSTPRRLDAQLKNLGATRKTVAQPFPAGAPLEVAANGVAAGSTARDAVQLDLADVDTQAFQCPRCSRVLGMDAKRCSKCGTTTDGVDKMESAARLSAAKAEVASAAESRKRSRRASRPRRPRRRSRRRRMRSTRARRRRRRWQRRPGRRRSYTPP